MEPKDELKEIDIKHCMCYYFYDTMKVLEINFDILLDKKSHENLYKNILIYDISFEPLWLKNHCVLGSIK